MLWRREGPFFVDSLQAINHTAYDEFHFCRHDKTKRKASDGTRYESYIQGMEFNKEHFPLRALLSCLWLKVTICGIAIFRSFKRISITDAI
jgi:hypothetical protein